MEVAGINFYQGYSANYKPNIDFISRDCLSTLYKMNDTHTNIGGWTSTKLYQILNTTIYNTLPSDVRAVIGMKRLLLEDKKAVESTTWAWYDETKLWIPGEKEVFGYAQWSQQGYGGGNFKQYPIFMMGDRHIIKGKGNGGSAYWWWELSPDYGNTSAFCSVNSSGFANAIGAANESAVPLCFRVS